MSATKERIERAERSHREAAALIEIERIEREKKTAKLRELRLAKEAADSLARRNTAPVKTGSKAKIKKAQIGKSRVAAPELETAEFEEALDAMVEQIATQSQNAAADTQIVEGAQDAIRSSKKVLKDPNSN